MQEQNDQRLPVDAYGTASQDGLTDRLSFSSQEREWNDRESVDTDHVTTFEVEQNEKALAEHEAQTETASFLDRFDAAKDREWIHRHVIENMGREEYPVDPEWRIDEESFKGLTEGLADDLWDSFALTRSEDEAWALRDRFLEIQEQEKLLYEGGITSGTGIRILAALTDPTALGVGVLGGVLSGGATTSAVVSNKAYRIKRAVDTAKVSALTSLGVDGALNALDPTLDGEDLAWAVASSAVVGAGIGGMLPVSKEGKAAIERFALQEEALLLQRNGMKMTPAGQAHYGPLPQSKPSINTAPGAQNQANTASPSGTAAQPAQPAATQPRSARMKDYADQSATDDEAFGAKTNLTRSGFTWGSKNRMMRGIASRWVDYAPGWKDKNKVSQHTVVERKKALAERYMTEYSRSEIETFNGYLKDIGKSQHGYEFRTGLKARFDERVAQIVRGAQLTNSPMDRHAKKHADEISRLYAEQLQRQKDAGVKGADTVAPNSNYLNRQWDYRRLNEYDRVHGKDAAATRIGNAIQDTKGTLTPKQRLQFARTLIETLRKARSHHAKDLGNLLALPEADLAVVLRSGGLDESDINDIVAKLAGAKNFQGRGKGPRMKHRLSLDETQIDDFLNNDMRSLFQSYTDGQMGRVVLAREGLFDDADFDELKNVISKEYDDLGDFGKRRDVEMNQLDQIYNSIMGRPIQGDPSSLLDTSTRVAREAAFNMVMNQVGFAQIPEFGNVLAQNGMKALWHVIPALRTLKRDISTGKLRGDEFLDSMEVALGGLGGRRMLHAMTPDVEEFGTSASSYGKVELGFQKLNKVTSSISGMDGITQVLQRISVRSNLDGFVTEALKGKKVMSQARMNDLGIDEVMRKKIMKRIKNKRVTTAEMKLGRLKNFDFDRWPDDEVTEAFTLAIRRWTTQNVQEIGVGDKLISSDTALAKCFLQFRQFVIGAYNKQMLPHLKHGMNDFNAFQAVMYTTFLGMMAYVGQTNLRSMGRDDQDEFLTDKLGTSHGVFANLDDPDVVRKIFLTGIQRSGAFSVMPGVFDTVSPVNLFDERTTGLSSQFIDLNGNPTMSNINTLYKGTDGLLGALFTNQEFTESEGKALKRILPFNNFVGIEAFLHNIIDRTLPEREGQF